MYSAPEHNQIKQALPQSIFFKLLLLFSGQLI